LKFRKLLKVSDVPVGNSKVVYINQIQFLVLNRAGNFFVVENSCPHKGATLNEGPLTDTTLTCPLHGWVWQLSDGSNTVDPTKTLLTLPVEIRGEELWVCEPEF
jgi:nitrite reductase (NADH) small subunit